MKTKNKKVEKRIRRHIKIRTRLSGSAKIPRLSVFRSNRYIYSQLIDDDKGITLVSAKGDEPKKVGASIAEKAKKAKISKVVFDRGGFAYKGKVKALAEAAREGGLKF